MLTFDITCQSWQRKEQWSEATGQMVRDFLLKIVTLLDNVENYVRVEHDIDVNMAHAHFTLDT